MRPSLTSSAGIGRLLLGAVVFLVCLGLVMVYSATSARAVIFGLSPTGQIARQVVYAILGFLVLAFVIRAKPVVLERVARPLVIVAGALLLAVMILPPAMAPTINGANRWIVLGGVQLQPSEIAKLALILWIAAMVARDPKALRSDRGLVPYMVLTGVFALMILKEPDLGTAAILVAIAFAMVFVAGAPVRRLAILGGIGAGLAILSIVISPYQRSRVEGFVDPWSDPTAQTSYQNVQAQIAIGSGGVLGRGLGNSVQKNNFLPEAHTDMIGAIIGEELGLIGLIAVMVAFVLVGLCGFRIAMRAPSIHLRLLAIGITSMICLQGAINLAQVLGAFPITGVPLPFVSAGGTNLLVSLAGIGILINISRQGANASGRRARPVTPRGDRGRRDGRTRDAGAGNRRRLAS